MGRFEDVEKYKEDILKRFRSIVEDRGFKEIYTQKDVYPDRFRERAESEVRKISDYLNKRRREIGEEEMDDEELYASLMSIHELAERWPKVIKERVEAVLEVAPKPPEGPEGP